MTVKENKKMHDNSSLKILNFGSLNIDYVYTVDHFVRPGETISSINYEVFAGGKGLNQSVALSRALSNNSIKVFHAGGIGEDGLFLKDILTKEQINTDFLKIHQIASGHAIIQIDSSGQNCILLHGGANQKQSEDYIDTVLSAFKPNDYLVLQNEINTMPYLITKAHQAGLKIFFNPSPWTLHIHDYPLQYIDTFLLNELEARDMCQRPNASYHELLDQLLKQFPQAHFVLTLGKEGVLYADAQERHSHGIFKVPVVDTTAAGDTFTGYFISSLAQQYSIPDCLCRASLAASIAVSRKGAVPSIPKQEELETFIGS